jgi:hypothetical protein
LIEIIKLKILSKSERIFLIYIKIYEVRVIKTININIPNNSILMSPPSSIYSLGYFPPEKKL